MSAAQLHASIGQIAAAGNLSRGETNLLRASFPLSTLVAANTTVAIPDPGQPQNILKTLQNDSRDEASHGDATGVTHLQKLIADLKAIQQ